MEIIKDLPEVFEEFAEQRQKSFLAVKQLKDKGIPVIGSYCTYFPKEIAMAMGAATVSLCSTSDETIPAAEKDLPRNLCPLIKSSYGFAKTDKCPFFYFSDVVVGETTCDGKKKMYEYMDDNPAFEMHPVDYTNNPYVIGQHDNFISVNACVEIDLFGQVCAESLGTLHYSGSGGQVDFVRGANLSKGGKGFIAMTSTAKNGTVSKVKPVLTPGSIVTTSKNEVDFLVTENNIVRLKGRTASERAKMIISLAAPEFRDELLFEAKKMNLIV